MDRRSARRTARPPLSLQLTPQERALLEEVRVSDEDHGGLDLDELADDEVEIVTRLLDRGLVEATNEFGEAPMAKRTSVRRAAAAGACV